MGGTVNANNYDQTFTTYNFPNQPTTVTRKHWTSAITSYPLVTIANTYLYDQVGRKLKSWEQITNGNSTPTTKTLISKIDYNEIGQVLNKHLHSTDSVSFYQNVGYTYNERGWLLSTSAPLFAMNLYYNTSAGNKMWNGNIMYQYWGTPGNQNQHYAYAYDKLNRLIAGSSTANNNEYPAYDLHGNITALNRSIGPTYTNIDQLTYSYTVSGNPTNQVQSITDVSPNTGGLPGGTTGYTYDGNGNMLTQTNTTNTGSNKSVTYNLLNLPQSVTVPNGTVTYTYDATGQKLRKVAVISGITTTTEYIAGIQYKNSTTAIDFIQTEEGKAVPITTPYVGYDYTYYLGDNLGNTRITFNTKTGSAVSQQTDDYYPFGMEINSSVSSPKNEYLYNKKELQEELGQYDYGARFYDPVIGRWNVVDPLAEKYQALSPYDYVDNNPIKHLDGDGKEIIVANKAQQAQILGYINKLASGNFKFNAKGQLRFAGNKDNTKGTSEYYTKRLIAGITAKGEIDVKIGNTFKDPQTGKDRNIKDAGEGETNTKTTASDGKITKQADLTISGQPNTKDLQDTEGKSLPMSPAELLQHELVGHAIPFVDKTDTGNAIQNENKARKQEGKKLRKGEKDHVE